MNKAIRYIKKNLCQHWGKQNHYKQIKLQFAPHNNESTMWMFGSLFFTRKPQKGAVFLKKFMTYNKLPTSLVHFCISFSP